MGIVAIDHQHMALLDHINRLSAAVNHAINETEIKEVIAFLEDYVQIHFKAEESLMDQSGYPFTAEHKRQHTVFHQYLTS